MKKLSGKIAPMLPISAVNIITIAVQLFLFGNGGKIYKL
jgi:hypothetical protein